MFDQAAVRRNFMSVAIWGKPNKEASENVCDCVRCKLTNSLRADVSNFSARKITSQFPAKLLRAQFRSAVSELRNWLINLALCIITSQRKPVIFTVNRVQSPQ